MRRRCERRCHPGQTAGARERLVGRRHCRWPDPRAGGALVTAFNEEKHADQVLAVLTKQPAGGKARVWSGVLCHFCGLAPMDLYFGLADKLRAAAGLLAMNRALFKPVVLTTQHHREADGQE